MLDRMIRSRRSSRQFKDRPVERETVTRILDAARYAPSARNSQPWRFLVLSGPQELTDMLAVGNEWVLAAPLIMVVMQERDSSPMNLGFAIQNMLLTATQLGLSGHVVGGVDQDALGERIQVDETLSIACLLVFGYPDAGEERNPERKPLSEIAFHGDMDHPWPDSVRTRPERTIDIPIQIRFRDLDAMGHVNNATYFTFLEEARIAFRDRVRGPGNHPHDFDVVVAENHLAYRRAILPGEAIVIKCWISDIRDKSYRFHYSLVNEETGEEKASGYTVMVGFDYRAGTVQPLDPGFRQRVAPYSV